MHTSFSTLEHPKEVENFEEEKKESQIPYAKQIAKGLVFPWDLAKVKCSILGKNVLSH